MTDNLIDKAFATHPKPDSEAKKRALALALMEFDAVQETQALEKQAADTQPAEGPAAQKDSASQKKLSGLQGFLAWLRLMGTHNPNRTDSMNGNAFRFAQKKLLISGLATCSLAVVGVLLFQQMPLHTSSSMRDDLAMPKEVRRPEATAGADQAAEEIIVTGARELEIAAQYSPTEPMVIAEQQAMSAKRAQETARLAMPASPMPSVAPPAELRDRFAEFQENSVKAVTEEPVSTFSIDVDTAAYSFVRRNLNNGYLPPKDAVRVEELINYFDYQYPVPSDKASPFLPSVSVMDSPWKAGNKLIHIGIKGYQLPASAIPRSNLVFLLDVSGSMHSPDKLPLVQQSMELLLNNLQPEDTVAIVVYAGAAGTVLEPTPVKDKQKILRAVQQLQAGGSTAGAEGIQRAYELAEASFDSKAVNRIILATDGDFNVGPTGDSDLQTLVERKRDQGIYLSVLGFGQGNYQDAMMQTLAQHGNGIAAYIDTLSEAQKVLVHEATSTLFPIANDVKIQVEFNPATVAEYRLIGYETRALQREDFNNDKVDAGDIGAGHSLTAIYEITPVGEGKPLLEPSRYATEKTTPADKLGDEYAFLRIRYKLPGEKQSRLIEEPISIKQFITLDKVAPGSLQQEAGFATAVAGFAQLLRGSHFTGDYSYDDVIALAQKTKGTDDYGYRTEFIQLVRKAKLAKAM